MRFIKFLFVFLVLVALQLYTFWEFGKPTEGEIRLIGIILPILVSMSMIGSIMLVWTQLPKYHLSSGRLNWSLYCSRDLLIFYLLIPVICGAGWSKYVWYIIGIPIGVISIWQFHVWQDWFDNLLLIRALEKGRAQSTTSTVACP